jgi:hypothetical protein
LLLLTGNFLQIPSPFRQLLGNSNQGLRNCVSGKDSLVEVARHVHARPSHTAQFHEGNRFLCESISGLRIHQVQRKSPWYISPIEECFRIACLENSSNDGSLPCAGGPRGNSFLAQKVANEVTYYSIAPAAYTQRKSGQFAFSLSS